MKKQEIISFILIGLFLFDSIGYVISFSSYPFHGSTSHVNCIHNRIQALYYPKRNKKMYKISKRRKTIEQKRRELLNNNNKNSNSNTNTNTIEMNNIRIKIILDNIQLSNNTHITMPTIKSMIHNAVKYFSSRIQVFPIDHEIIVENCLDLSTFEGTGYDLVLFFSNVQKHCGVNTIAYSSICELHYETRRPVSGIINFCKLDQVYHSSGNLKDFYKTIIHEMYHVFGFSNYILTKWPNQEMTKKYSERNEFVTKIVSPSIKKYVQNYFNCPTLNGAELDFSNSHLKMRIYKGSIMAAILEKDTRLDILPMIALCDLKFYNCKNFSLSLSSSSPPTLYPFEYNNNVESFELRFWGKSLGCKFALDTCLNSYLEHPKLSPFCFKVLEEKCSYNANYKGKCIYMRYGIKVPPQNRYFTDDTVGGRQIMDFCPIYERIETCSSNTKCIDTTTTTTTTTITTKNNNNLECLEYACISSETFAINYKDKWESCKEIGICPKNLEPFCHNFNFNILNLTSTNIISIISNSGKSSMGEFIICIFLIIICI